jgi:prenyltransferase beta subunit
LYDSSTGAQVYADSWSYLLTSFGYNVLLLSLQQAMENSNLTQGYDLILVDHSCGADHGSAIDLGEAVALTELGKPLILLGGAHGVIDRLANYTGGVSQISAAGIIQKAHGRSDHTIYSSPYLIAEAGFGAADSIEIFAQTVSLESYPDNAIKFLNTLGVLEGAAKPVIGALYSAHCTNGRILWWSFKDPSTLNTNGRHLFVNTVEWMGGLTDLSLVADFLKGIESLDPSKSTYWAGGYADYFEPEIPATYYAYASLKLVGRSATINSSALIDWLTAYCYAPAQGFFHSPNRYLSPIYWSGTVETGMALVVLSELGAVGKINSSKTSKYIESCQQADGFARYPGDASKSLTNTYWALIGLNTTGALIDINGAGCINYILSCQNLNQSDEANYGGFADCPGALSSATSTYMALMSLRLLGAMASVNLNITEQWLMNGYVAAKGIFYDDHLFHQRYMVNCGTGYSVASLSMIGKLQNIDRTRVADYLSSVQFTDGGWSGANSTDEAIDELTDCYPIVLGLEHLNQIASIRNLDGFVGFVIRCLSPSSSYGFANLPQTFSNIWHTYDGISILNDLGIIDSSAAAHLSAFIISSYNPTPGWFEWSRCIFPLSSDGYWNRNVELPFEFTPLQRDKRGVVIDDLAVQSLLCLGSTNWVGAHAQQLWNEITRCEVTTGSNSGYYKRLSSDLVSNLTSGLRYTYHALNCLWAIASFLGYATSFVGHLTNATMTISRIMSLYNPSVGSFKDDGYILEPYSTVQTTSMGLASLSLLNGLSNVDCIKTASFLQSHLYSNLVDTYYSFKGLEVLNKVTTINATRLIQFIEDCQKPNGVFASDETALYRLETTRMAIEILSYYNYTWLAARPIALIANNFKAPAAMDLGSSHLVNVTVTDNCFMLKATNASMRLRLGTYEYAGTETETGSGCYTANITVPVDRNLLGTQDLSVKCSKEKYQTSFANVSVEIRRGAGNPNITLTQMAFAHPTDSDYLTTSNTSIAVLIFASNTSQTPIRGAQLQLYVDNLIVENSTSDPSGFAAFKWRPHSSGVYSLKATFEGSSTLDPSKVEKTITVNKTPTQLSTYSNCSSPSSVSAGSTLQLRTLLSQGLEGKPVANASIDFVVLTPSGTRMDFIVSTGENGVAQILLTVSESGSYSIYSVFRSTEYCSGCNSNTVTLIVGPSSPDGGGGGTTSDGGGVSWVSALLGALTTPLGFGLVISSGGLLTMAYLIKTKQRGVESSNSHANDREEPNSFRLEVQRRLRRKRRGIENG